MRVKGNFPLWAWVAGPAAILLAAVALLALLGEGRADPEPAQVVTYEDVADNPQRFYGETVTVGAWVEAVLGPRSLLTSSRFVAGDMLVVSDAPLRETLEPGAADEDAVALKHTTVWVTGEVRRFDLAGAEGNLDKGALDAYVGTTAIIADSVSLERPAAADEGGRPSGAREDRAGLPRPGGPVEARG